MTGQAIQWVQRETFADFPSNRKHKLSRVGLTRTTAATSASAARASSASDDVGKAGFAAFARVAESKSAGSPPLLALGTCRRRFLKIG